MSDNDDKRVIHRLRESATSIAMAKVPGATQSTSDMSKAATSAAIPQVPRTYAATSAMMVKIPEATPIGDVIIRGATCNAMPKIPPKAGGKTKK